MKLNISFARLVAYDLLTKVMHEKQKPEVLLEQSFKEHSKELSRLDRNFIKELLYGSLRWYSKIFWILQKTASRDLSKTPPALQTALVMGTYQIFYLDRVPDRAAVNESVEYVRIRGQASAVSFVNGILRQIARRAEYFAKPDKVTKASDYLALQFAHPKWMVDRWAQHFRFEKLEVMLASNNQVPPYSIRINTLKVKTKDAHDLQQALLRDEKTHSERRPLRVCLQLRESPKIDAGSLFADGQFSIQDEAAQLIGYLVDPKAEEVIIDACAAPGGKLFHMHELSEGQAKVIGIEKKIEKMPRLKENMERLGHTGIELICADFLEWTPTKDQTPTKILLDAPCSGLGVLRRHPEGKWHKQSTIVRQCTEVQKALLTKAVNLLETGGEIVYSVCSFEKEETIDQLNWLQKEFEGRIEQLSPVSRIPDYYKRYVTRDNILLVFSGNQDEMDGFGAFIVKVAPAKKPKKKTKTDD